MVGRAGQEEGRLLLTSLGVEGKGREGGKGGGGGGGGAEYYTFFLGLGPVIVRV